MSEYWVSTPNYWCKNCRTYVRETEKSKHEATPRHQGNLKRFIRDLHRENERADRDKQRAKDEVARLNGAVPTPKGSGLFKQTVTSSNTVTRNPTPDERKRQMAQLAQMGVAVPDDFRKENAMVGNWETVSRRIIEPDGSDIKAEEDIDVKPDLNVGVRKRKTEEETEDVFPKLKEGRRWPRYGTDIRALPGEGDDLDALLGTTRSLTKKVKTEPKSAIDGDAETVKTARQPEQKPEADDEPIADTSRQPTIKTEEPPNGSMAEIQASGLDSLVKAENEDEEVGAMFKKRKPKSLRQK